MNIKNRISAKARESICSTMFDAPGASMNEILDAFHDIHPGLCSKYPRWRRIVAREVSLLQQSGDIRFSESLRGWMFSRSSPLKPKQLKRRYDPSPVVPFSAPYMPSGWRGEVSAGLPSLGKRR